MFLPRIENPESDTVKPDEACLSLAEHGLTRPANIFTGCFRSRAPSRWSARSQISVVTIGSGRDMFSALVTDTHRGPISQQPVDRHVGELSSIAQIIENILLLPSKGAII